ncbi:MAG TPA: 2-succinyl-5-enolpyruvyl-6-hydroxy-3-cyclohexene-1-carboxylic-acid synthase [Acidimicrobiales bacterium]|jgi:2-succinyl-5-enolpyruvyl-6-hydroxy-3-cyclohexene-1-carboxylate synthase|nr:2-succinyl-5-enolpyruvyl-6-hydroxy-3-cyclohexene-1-carboxylic-acid synthase [Acidimicrobiales bacterium]
MNRPADVQAAFCAVLCDEWARAGVTHAVVAPGSRSTPLLIALDAEDRIQVTVVLDERSAGFTALGLGLASGRPALVVTTSGTASVELHPAVVEAHYAHVPLIAVTTDRPPELQEVGAPQTVDQVGLFGKAVRWSAHPGVASVESQSMWRSLATRAVAEAARGPVHLNLAFREPLIGDPAAVAWPPARPEGAPWHALGNVAAAGPDPELVALLAAHTGGRGLIVAGQGADVDGGAPAVFALAAHVGWPVLADPRSGCRAPHELLVSTADLLLRSDFADQQPDVVLRLGTPWASKVLNQWLAALPAGVPQVFVDPLGRWADPERSARYLSSTTARGLLQALTGSARPATNTGWTQGWQQAEATARATVEQLLAAGGDLELSEPAVAAACLRAGVLFTSSSMPVRDVEWFGPPVAGARVLCNRGANGIDGVISTAIGVAQADPDVPVVGLLGDLAFLYDAGALLWAARRDVRLSLVVIDNGGGGIFSFLPQAAALPESRFERYWGTPHGLDLTRVAASYGVAATRIDDRTDLDRFLAGAGGPGIRVAVVPSDRAGNVAAHDRINSAVAEALGRGHTSSHGGARTD